MKAKPSKERPPTAGLVIIGLGNIGSQLVPLIAFQRPLKRVVLVDKDLYEPTNLATQGITRADLGRAKARVQAERLRRLNPRLEVTALCEDVAHIAPGRLRGALIIACVDSLETRIRINQFACHLGIPWLDGGVEPKHHLVRVSGFAPHFRNPCFECALTDEDYSDLGSSLPCQPPGRATTPTNGPASLGALAAALLAVECDKLLNRRFESSLLGKQLILETEHHIHRIDALRRNECCRFGHVTWQISSLKGLMTQLTVKQALVLAGRLAGSDVSLSIPGGAFTRAVRCPRCGNVRTGFHLLGRLPKKSQLCHRCDGPLLASGIDLVPALDGQLPARILSRSLQRLGVRTGDIFEVLGSKSVFRCEVGCSAESRGEDSSGKQSELQGNRAWACEAERQSKRSGKRL